MNPYANYNPYATYGQMGVGVVSGGAVGGIPPGVGGGAGGGAGGPQPRGGWTPAYPTGAATGAGNIHNPYASPPGMYYNPASAAVVGVAGMIGPGGVIMQPASTTSGAVTAANASSSMMMMQQQQPPAPRVRKVSVITVRDVP
jgi:hypothetical protein